MNLQRFLEFLRLFLEAVAARQQQSAPAGAQASPPPCDPALKQLADDAAAKL